MNIPSIKPMNPNKKRHIRTISRNQIGRIFHCKFSKLIEKGTNFRWSSICIISKDRKSTVTLNSHRYKHCSQFQYYRSPHKVKHIKNYFVLDSIPHTYKDYKNGNI